MPKAKKSKEDVVKSMNCREDINRINFSSSPTKTADRRNLQQREESKDQAKGIKKIKKDLNILSSEFKEGELVTDFIKNQIGVAVKRNKFTKKPNSKDNNLTMKGSNYKNLSVVTSVSAHPKRLINDSSPMLSHNMQPITLKNELAKSGLVSRTNILDNSDSNIRKQEGRLGNYTLQAPKSGYAKNYSSSAHSNSNYSNMDLSNRNILESFREQHTPSPQLSEKDKISLTKTNK